MEIDPDSDVPRYQQLASLLRRQIEDGTIAERRPLPSKRTMRQQYGVSAGTIDKAMNLLRAEGLIKTVLGLGLYVVARGDRPVND